jgi:tetratricopeptide (TPR) repeat protein
MAISVLPIRAQRKQSSTGMGVLAREGKFPDMLYDSTGTKGVIADEEKCFPWVSSEVGSATVSTARLNVPSKARREYEKACDAFNKNRFEEAERNARSAIEQFQNYSGAWVALGLILEEQHKRPEARNACSQAAAIDSTYLPAYLCSAEFSVRDHEWEQVLKMADLALGLQSGRDTYAYYYRATAYLYLNNLAEAKESALRAVEIDRNHDEPLLYLLLAKIYARDGDSPNAIAQLHQFLKYHPDRRQEVAAWQLLAKLDMQPSTK